MPEEDDEEDDEEPLSFSWILASVLAPAMPSASRPLSRWNWATASLVRLPKLPVTEPFL